MIYHGHIENGLVVLNEPVALPDGAEVLVHIQVEPNQEDQGARVRTYALSGVTRNGHLRRRCRSGRRCVICAMHRGKMPQQAHG